MAGASGELPAAETCAITEGEEEDDVIFEDGKKNGLFSKFKNKANDIDMVCSYFLFLSISNNSVVYCGKTHGWRRVGVLTSVSITSTICDTLYVISYIVASVQHGSPYHFMLNTLVSTCLET